MMKNVKNATMNVVIMSQKKFEFGNSLNDRVSGLLSVFSFLDSGMNTIGFETCSL